MRAEKQLLSQVTLVDLCLPALSANHKLYGTTRSTGVHSSQREEERQGGEKGGGKK